MFLAEAGKFVGQKVAGVLIALAVVAGGIWCWQHPAEVREFGRVIKLTFVWILVAAALPWTSFLFMRPLLRFQAESLSSRGAAIASVVLIGIYLLIDVLVALWMSEWSVSGAFTGFVLLIGFMAAAAYNYVICESLARQVDS